MNNVFVSDVSDCSGMAKWDEHRGDFRMGLRLTYYIDIHLDLGACSTVYI